MATFQNRATLTYNGQSVASNTVTGEITETLKMTKTALLPTYGDDRIVYIVTIVNSGAQPFTGLVLTDDLGAYPFGGETVYPLSYVDGSLSLFENGEPQSPPAVTADAGLTVTDVSVPANGNIVLIYAVNATGYAPRAAGEGVTNTVKATGGGVVSPLSAEATVLAEENARLSIYKSLTPNVVPENGQIAFTFVIENTGVSPADAAANVLVSDLFDPILSDLSVTLDGTPMARAAGYTYDDATGQFQTVAGAITVPAATVTQDPDTGAYTVQPGKTTLVVSGTV